MDQGHQYILNKKFFHLVMTLTTRLITVDGGYKEKPAINYSPG